MCRGAPWPKEGRAAPSPTPPAVSSAFLLRSISAFPKNASWPRRRRRSRCHGVPAAIPSPPPHPARCPPPVLCSSLPHLQVRGEHVLQLALLPPPALLLLVPLCRARIQAALRGEVPRSPYKQQPHSIPLHEGARGRPRAAGRARARPHRLGAPLLARSIPWGHPRWDGDTGKGLWGSLPSSGCPSALSPSRPTSASTAGTFFRRMWDLRCRTMKPPMPGGGQNRR